MSHVAVVILNWNGKKHLEQFLPSVLKSTYPDLSIIIGDNGSSDDSVEFVKASFPDVEIITTGVNLGFTGGYNRILEKVQADYFILLNSDVQVDPEWIDPMIALLEENPEIAACQPKIRSYNNPDFFEHAGAAGGYLDKFGYPFCRGRILNCLEKDNGQYDDPCQIFWATGAALTIRRSDWNEMKGFDTDFFAHMEEIDLCWRLKRAGKQIWYCPKSTVYHVGGGTLSKEDPFKTYLNFRNNLFLLQKNLPFFQAFFILFLRFWLDLLALLRFTFEGKHKDAKAVSKAHVNFLRNFVKTSKKRKTSGLTFRYPLVGIYQRSIMWDFFIKKNHAFSSLKQRLFVRNDSKKK